jgi:Fe-S-cluster formation regulator IscX/YfhJ
MRKQNYLNNKDILKEIHKSKNTYNSYVDPEYADYDIILPSIEKINIRTIAEAKRNKAKRLSTEDYEHRKSIGEKVKQIDCEIDYKTIEKTDLIFRIMTFDHIPDEPGRKKNPKTVADTKTKLNFPPFQHWKFDESDELVCVGKSHWIGGMENGYFSKDHGKSTNKLAMMWMKLVDRYATRGNVRGYSYNDEMKGQAIVQLAQIGLQFDESKSNNPFAYYTAAVTNSFVRVINIEKRNQVIRDDILEMNNLDPSHSRQAEGEWEASVKRNESANATEFTKK